MRTREIQKADKQIKKHGRKVSANKVSAEIFLKKIGVLTSNGNVNGPYRKLCTQHDQD